MYTYVPMKAVSKPATHFFVTFLDLLLGRLFIRTGLFPMT